MSSSYRCTSYQTVLVLVFRFSLGFSVCVCVKGPRASLFTLCFWCILSCLLCCQYQCKWLPGKTRLRNDLLCVERDVKLYSLTHLPIQCIALLADNNLQSGLYSANSVASSTLMKETCASVRVLTSADINLNPGCSNFCKVGCYFWEREMRNFLLIFTDELWHVLAGYWLQQVV